MNSSTQKIAPFHSPAFPHRYLHKKSFSKKLQIANQLIEQYNAILAHAPSPQRLFFQMINLEAITSIESQKVKTTLEDFLRFIQEEPRKRISKFKIILNYRQTFLWGWKNVLNSSLNKEFLCTLHKKAKRGTTLKSNLGVYRNRQNWIGPEGCKIENAYFYPPAESEVEGLMRELFNYVKRDEKEPILQLALIFAQLLIIHPFMDGNGRVARLLIPLFLYWKKVIPVPFLFMSHYFLQHRLKYFQKLFKTTEGNKWEAWVIFFLKGIIVEMRRTLRLFNQTIALYNEIKLKIPMLRKETVFFLFQNPVFSRSSFRKAKGDQDLLEQLRKLKFIKKENEKYYFFPLLKVLNVQKRMNPERKPPGVH